MQRTGQACPGNQKKKKKKEKKKRKRKKKKKRQHPGKKKKRKKKRRRRKRQRLETTKKKKKQRIGQSPCASAYRHFCHLPIKLPPLSFLSILERTFWWTHLAPINIFLSPSSNQTFFKKFSLLIFSHFFFFFHPPQNPLYQTDLQC